MDEGSGWASCRNHILGKDAAPGQVPFSLVKRETSLPTSDSPLVLRWQENVTCETSSGTEGEGWSYDGSQSHQA